MFSFHSIFLLSKYFVFITDIIVFNFVLLLITFKKYVEPKNVDIFKAFLKGFSSSLNFFAKVIKIYLNCV